MHVTTLVFAGLGLTFSTLTFAQSDPAWAAQFQGAVSQLRTGETAAALQSFDRLWTINSNDAQLAAWIGVSLDSTALHKDATPWYRRSLAIQPDFEPALNNLALNYASLGEFSKALPLIRQASRMNPSDAKLAYNLGLVCLRVRHYEEAADAFQRARQTSHEPTSLQQITLAEATARFGLREYAKAIILLERVHDGPNYKRLLLLGSAQALSGDLPKAVKSFQQAVSLSPNDPQAYYRLGLVFMLGHLNAEAQNVLSEGLKAIPKSALLLYGKAVCDNAQGRWDNAVDWARQSLNADPRQPEVWTLLGSLDAKLDQTDEALKAYRQALALGAGVDVGVDLAELLIRLQRLPEADAELCELAKKYPGDAHVDRGFGKLYRQERKFDLAEKYLRRAIRLDPDDAQAHFALVEVFRLTHRMEEARTEFAVFNEKKQTHEATRLLELAANPSSEAVLK